MCQYSIFFQLSLFYFKTLKLFTSNFSRRIAMRSKHFKRIATALLCVMVPSAPAFAIDHLGTNTFYAPPMHEVNDLYTMVQKEKYQIKIGLRAEGLRSIYEDFMEQIKTTEIREVQYPTGTHLQWMFFRKNGTGPLRIDKDVTWDADTPFTGFEFTIDSNGNRYTFVVPEKCGNLALKGVSAIPAVAPTPAPAPAPTPVVEKPAPQPVAVVPPRSPCRKRLYICCRSGCHASGGPSDLRLWSFWRRRTYQ